MALSAHGRLALRLDAEADAMQALREANVIGVRIGSSMLILQSAGLMTGLVAEKARRGEAMPLAARPLTHRNPIQRTIPSAMLDRIGSAGAAPHASAGAARSSDAASSASCFHVPSSTGTPSRRRSSRVRRSGSPATRTGVAGSIAAQPFT